MNAYSGKRRIDRIADPDLPDRIASLPVDQLRALRDDCREEEARLGYLRRIVQGQLDVARAERERRAGAGGGDLLDVLPSVLADAPAAHPADARALSLYDPGDEPARRRDDLTGDDVVLARLPDMPDDELAALIERLAARERRLSDQRRLVLERLDALQAELVTRYRDGRAAVEEVLTLPTADPRR